MMPSSAPPPSTFPNPLGGSAAEASILDDPGRLVNAILPWAISLVFHITVFLFMFLVVWVVQARREEQLLPISHAELSDDFDPAMFQGLDDPRLEVSEELVPIQGQAIYDQPIDLLREVAAAGHGAAGGSGGDGIAIIGIGAGGGTGELSQYGLSTVGLGEGPSFFGLGRGELDTRRICYVVDRSGSMVDELDYVKEEVRRSIERLHRVQQFHIIFFSGGPPIESPPGRFVHAIREYKAQAFEFVSTIEADGSTDPGPALGRAIQLGADLIYFLTDGEFQPDVLEKLRIWNKDKKVRIYTIAFVRRNGEDLLRQIARENKGEFKFVSEDDLD